MYKDKSSTTAYAPPQESKFVSLDELPKVTIYIKGVSDRENGSGAPIPIVLQFHQSHLHLQLQFTGPPGPLTLATVFIHLELHSAN